MAELDCCCVRDDDEQCDECTLGRHAYCERRAELEADVGTVDWSAQ